MPEILIAGGGPAGSAAAIAARLEGAPVRIFERATSPRHKVCGEFISPGASGLLESLGVWADFSAIGPRQIRRCVIHFGRRAKCWNLRDCAWGLSRLELDRLLLAKAVSLGAAVVRGRAFTPEGPQRTAPLVAAYGRTAPLGRASRLFGFKAHFEGPCEDSVELFFDTESYAGVSGIEGG